MPDKMTLKIADLLIGVEYESKRIADLCRDYIVSGEKSDIRVVYDRKKCSDEAKIYGHGMTSAEFAMAYRQIAEALPHYKRVVTHGALISYNGKGYMFIAKSGTGKTTHINLWREFFPGTKVINGDKPIIASDNGKITAYGTPWSGKEMLQENTSVPLCGICLITRSKENSIKELEAERILESMLSQVYMPEKIESLNLTMKIIDDIIRCVPFYELSCNISREAAECAFSALTGEKI